MKAELHVYLRSKCVRTWAPLAVALLTSVTVTAQSSNNQAASGDYDQTVTSSGTRPSYPGLPHRGANLETDLGPFKARFYGTILMNGQISDTGVFGQDLVLWSLPDSVGVTYPDGTTSRVGNNHDLVFSARQSVVGMTLNPSKPADRAWNPSALVEMDFFGSRPSDAVQPLNRVLNQPRLRLAYAQMEKGSVRIVAGQDKMILSPLDPISLSHVAAPLGATAGNL